MSSTRQGLFLALWGLFAAVSGIFLYYPRGRPGIGGSLRWLTLLLAVIVGGGLLSVAAFHSKQRTDGVSKLLGLIIVVVSVVGGLGSIVALSPWQFEGSGQSLILFGLLLLLVGWTLLVGLGTVFYRSRNGRYSLYVIAGLTIGFVLYPLDDANMLAEYPDGVYPVLAAFLLGVTLLATYSVTNWEISVDTDVET